MADQAGGQGAATTAKPTNVKLVLLGEAAVGKSSLVLRFVSNTFQPSKEPTIGAAFLTQKIALPPPKSRTIKFEIWDTAGQERFASLAPMYYRNAQAALVCYDVTKAPSLGKARRWVEELQRQASPGLVVGLVGCKVDLVEDAEAAGAGADDEADGTATSAAATVAATTAGDTAAAGADAAGGADAEGAAGAGEHKVRQVKTEEARAYADAEGLLFFETSAKTGANVAEVFAAIADAIPEAALKGARGGAGAGGGANGGAAGGRGAAGAAAGDAGRVVLGQGAQGPKEGCAC